MNRTARTADTARSAAAGLRRAPRAGGRAGAGARGRGGAEPNFRAVHCGARHRAENDSSCPVVGSAEQHAQSTAYIKTARNSHQDNC